MKTIDIDSVMVHDAFAYSKNRKIFVHGVRFINRHPSKSLDGYHFYVVISGRYTNGEKFRRMECKISQSNYNYYMENSFLTDYENKIKSYES